MHRDDDPRLVPPSSPDPDAGVADLSTGRRRVLTPELIRVFVASFGALSGFYLLLSVAPLYATSIGVNEFGAGLTTGVFMLSTVAAELVMPRLAARYDNRDLFCAGLVLLGAPPLVLIVIEDFGVLLLVSAVRGVGLAIVVVLGSALVAQRVAAERRGEGLGLYGVVVGVPSVAALPLGVWAAEHVGYPPVFAAGGMIALAGIAAVTGLPGGRPASAATIGVMSVIRDAAMVRPFVIFSVTAVAAGVVVTFVPIAVSDTSANLAAAALLAYGMVATVARWWAGRYSDRHGAAGLLVPAILSTAAGACALILTSNPAALLAGMVAVGAGFGIAQNATLTLMFDRTTESGYGAASALWNLGFDGGLGLGATGVGAVVAYAGLPSALILTAALALSTLIVAARDRR